MKRGDGEAALYPTWMHNMLYVLAALCLIVVCGGVNAAVPLSDYQRRVQEASVAMDSLLALTVETRNALRGDKNARPEVIQNLPTTERWVLARARTLPPTERVEWQSGTLTVDNRWLGKSLEEYEKLCAQNLDAENAAKRVVVITQIAQRLGALQMRLVEINDDIRKKERDKDTDKGKLNAILHRREFDEKTEESALRRLLGRLVEWLRNLLPNWKPLPLNGANGSSLIAVSRVIIYALLAALLSFIAWRFVLPMLRRRRKRNKVGTGGARVVLDERLEAGQSGADLLREADRLAREGDWRGAIRKGYIALLCEFGERKIVRLAQHKTNRDYLRDVRPHPTLYGEMQTLTENFERHWYGFNNANAGDWANFRAHCQQTMRTSIVNRES